LFSAGLEDGSVLLDSLKDIDVDMRFAPLLLDGFRFAAGHSFKLGGFNQPFDDVAGFHVGRRNLINGVGSLVKRGLSNSGVALDHFLSLSGLLFAADFVQVIVPPSTPLHPLELARPRGDLSQVRRSSVAVEPPATFSQGSARPKVAENAEGAKGAGRFAGLPFPGRARAIVVAHTRHVTTGGLLQGFGGLARIALR